jgi:hypothetical protein
MKSIQMDCFVVPPRNNKAVRVLVIPAQAGIYPLPPHRFSIMLRMTGSRTTLRHFEKKAQQQILALTILALIIINITIFV